MQRRCLRHPDHIKAHYVTNARWTHSSVKAGRLELYYTAIPRSMMEEFIKQMPEEAKQQQNSNMRIEGTPDELVTRALTSMTTLRTSAGFWRH